MNKKYQVFVSSTFMDLIDERKEVMQALLELDCFPVGMELFPAADDDQWTLIKGLIDDCDYYVLIIGGRYGSIGPKGVSYTQMEYEYAIESGIPVISFVHGEPKKIESGKTEQTSEGKAKLEVFKKLAKQKMCKFWNSPSDLGSQVSRSLIKLIRSKPRIGWIKADVTTSEEANQEINKLRKEIDLLKKQLTKIRTSAPEGTEDFQQGEDEFEMNFKYYHNSRNHNSSIQITWNRLFFILAPLMVDESTEDILHSELKKYLGDHLEENGSKNIRTSYITVNNLDFQTIKVQLIALGLIAKSEKKRSIKNSSTYWSITPFGETVMIKLRAKKKKK